MCVLNNKTLNSSDSGMLHCFIGPCPSFQFILNHYVTEIFCPCVKVIKPVYFVGLWLELFSNHGHQQSSEGKHNTKDHLQLITFKLLPSMQ